MPVDLERPVKIAPLGIALGNLLFKRFGRTGDAIVFGKQRHIPGHGFGCIGITKQIVSPKLAQDADFGILALPALAGDREADGDAADKFGIADPDLHGLQINTSCCVPSPLRQASARRAAATALR